MKNIGTSPMKNIGTSQMKNIGTSAMNNIRTNKTDKELMAHYKTPVSVLKKFIEDRQQTKNFNTEQQKTLAGIFGIVSHKTLSGQIAKNKMSQMLANVMKKLGYNDFMKDLGNKKPMVNIDNKINNILLSINEKLATNSAQLRTMQQYISNRGGKKKTPVKKKPAKKKPTSKKKVRKIHRGP